MRNRWITGAAVALLAASSLVQAEPDRKPLRETASFGLFRETDAETAHNQALAWLKSVGKTDAATMKSVDALWASDKPLIEKVSGTLELGDAKAARLLADAANPDTPAPTEVPSLIKDTKLPPFFRANLGLAYGKALTNRKVWEEGLDALKSVKPDDVVDPASYFFNRAVCEHALLLRADAAESIDRLVNDVVEGPDRYRVVAGLMLDDMLTWSDKGLDDIARKMNLIKDRLDLTRGGPKTRRMQREVLVKLDEKIKELENQAKGSSAANGGACPGGSGNGPASGNKPSSPAGDSALPSGIAKGDVDIKKIKEVAQVWGTLPEKERAAAMVELTRGMPAKYRDAIEAYFKQLGSSGK